MSVFVIGDTHLSLSSNKPMNIFKGWDDHEFRLESNWQKLVEKDDTVIIAGDVSWGMSLQESLDDFEFLNKLNGTKIILKGNHDYWWNTANKMNNFMAENGLNTIKFLHNNAFKIDDISIVGTRGWFFDAESENIDKVLARECGRLQRSIDMARSLGGEIVAFLHYPPISAIADCEPIIEVLQKNQVKRCYYGHLHGGAINSAVNGEKYGIDFRLVSADYLGFCPLFVKSKE